MPRTFDVAVVGAAGVVGETLVQLLEERDFPLGTLHLLGGGEDLGQSLSYRGKNLRVRALEAFDFGTVQLVFLAAAQSVSLAQLEAVRLAGCSVIDLGGMLDASRAPAVVPEVNPGRLEGLTAPYLLSSPNPGAVAIALVLAGLSKLVEPLSVTVTACMAVSGRGKQGVAELARQTVELLNARPVEPQFFDRQIAFNVLAQVEADDEQGHSQAERQLADDLKYLLARPDMGVAVSCLQVPVFFGDSFSVSIRTHDVCDLPAIRLALGNTAGVEYVEGDYPSAVVDAVGQDAVYVGRVRGALGGDAELNLWIVSDNARKGSALNAVQLAELLIKDHL